MADTNPIAPKTPTKGGWSDAERIALLVSFVESKGGPDWANVTIPEGRTQKACRHMWTRFKDEAKKADGAGDNGDAPKTPTSAMKRAAKDDGSGDTPSKSAKKGKKGGATEIKVKPEDAGEDAV